MIDRQGLRHEKLGGVSAKKSLGQHFLSSATYLRAIADAAHVEAGDLVLEVGPGKGSLTAELLSRGAKVIAVEKDDRLIAPLAERFAAQVATKQLALVHGDILDQDISKLLRGRRSSALNELRGAGKAAREAYRAYDDEPMGPRNKADRQSGRPTYKVVANVPYYISGTLIRLFLEAEHQPRQMSLLLQKEVVERIARSKKESLLSLSVKAYGTPLYIKKVPAGAFSPPPRVDSAILAISGISRGNFTKKGQEERFFALLHAGFAHKRKVIGTKLGAILGKNSGKALFLAKKRAEDVPLASWLDLARE